uniref:Dehydrogenase/reductase SDR family member 11-like n=1 Tax=Acanthochromis polyacanthus TaxID=80966 RepID=A0A3Q1FTZ4_9TELE
MFATIKAQHKGVDVCINNAGLSLHDSLLSGTTRGWRNMLDVNVLALSICTREAYQGGHSGHPFFSFCSVLGHLVGPVNDVHFYAATKFAVTALTEGLRQELREAKSHIRATSISPGVVDTEFGYRMYSDDPSKAEALYSRHKNLSGLDVAQAVLYVLGAPPHVQIGEILLRPVEQQL